MTRTVLAAAPARAFALLLAAALLAGWAPVAGAQPDVGNRLTVTADPEKPHEIDTKMLHDGRLQPEGGTVAIKFNFLVQMPAGTVCPLANIHVRYEPDKRMDWASEATAVLNHYSDTLYYDQSGADAPSSFPVSTQMTVRVTRNAPAFQSGEYGVSATATPGAGAPEGCNLLESLSERISVTVPNDYLPLVEYQPAKYILRAGQNKEVTFYVVATNYGNGATRIESTTAPASKAHLDLVTPPSLATLESRAESGASASYSKEIAFTARTPHTNGYTNTLYAFTASFRAGPLQPWTGEPDRQTITLSVQVQGVYVPGFDSASALGAVALGLVLVGLGARRRVG